MAETQAVQATRPPPWRDVRVLGIVGQIVAVVSVVLVLRWLIGNLFTNLDEAGIDRGFDVLNQPTNFAIRDANFDSRSPLWPDMVVIGVKNTLLSAAVGIVIAVILGVLIGIGRLSENWLVARLSQIYVEILRNIPPLVIIAFFSFAVFTFGPFPPFNPSSPPWQINLPGTDTTALILSNDRWGIPSIARDGDLLPFWIALAVAAVVAIGLWTWRTRVNINTGAPHRRGLWAWGGFLLIAVVAFVLLDTPYRWSWPMVSESGRRIEGGFATNAGYLSVTIALGLYTASHIAEIIRGSILAVPKGQTEAANALALTGLQRYRFVVLPQAMRIAIPPTINQFLNLTKNTSLATVVAYPEITSLVKTAIGNGKPAVQLLVMLMAIYLTFSLIISVVMNQVNRRFQLVGR
ncbi:MAG: ABC transporter permease subunit [Actinomycetota bacterium]